MDGSSDDGIHFSVYEDRGESFGGPQPLDAMVLHGGGRFTFLGYGIFKDDNVREGTGVPVAFYTDEFGVTARPVDQFRDGRFSAAPAIAASDPLSTGIEAVRKALSDLALTRGGVARAVLLEDATRQLDEIARLAGIKAAGARSG